MVACVPGRAAELAVIVPSAHYPEGPLWHGKRLYFAEMTRHRISVWDGKAVYPFWPQKGCGMTSIAPAGALFLVTCHLGRAVVWVKGIGRMAGLMTEDRAGRPIGNPNDSTADRKGGVYFTSSGDFALEAPATGRVYHVVPGGPPRRVAGGIRYANGVTLTPDAKHLLVSEHLGRRVLRYRIAPGGGLAERKVWLKLDDLVARGDDPYPLAGPDGLEHDRAGNLFIAEYGAGRILVVGPDRKLIKTIKVPNRFVTSLAFAPDGKTLYVTAPANNTVWPFKGAVYKISNPLD